MSHPVPGHDYTERHKEETSKEHAHRRRKGLSVGSSVKKLKSMINEPASKKWFAKHGLPKSEARSKALDKKKDIHRRQISDILDSRNPNEQ